MNTLACKRLLALAWRGPALVRQPRRRVILLYHGVGAAATATSAVAFAGQMRWLADNARVVSLDALLDGAGDERQPMVALTFDDGYASVATAAAPVLRALGWPATIYLNTGWIGDGAGRAADPALGHTAGETFMTWAQARALHACGWAVGSHGVEHADLTALDAAHTAAQLTQSRRCIEARLGVACRHFAYTWGRWNRRVSTAVAEAGYATAAAALHGPVTAHSDRYALPRIHVSHRYSVQDFAAAVRGDWDFLGWVQRARRIAWRAATDAQRGTPQP